MKVAMIQHSYLRYPRDLKVPAIAEELGELTGIISSLQFSCIYSDLGIPARYYQNPNASQESLASEKIDPAHHLFVLLL